MVLRVTESDWRALGVTGRQLETLGSDWGALGGALHWGEPEGDAAG